MCICVYARKRLHYVFMCVKDIFSMFKSICLQKCIARNMHINLQTCSHIYVFICVYASIRNYVRACARGLVPRYIEVNLHL